MNGRNQWGHRLVVVFDGSGCWSFGCWSEHMEVVVVDFGRVVGWHTGVWIFVGGWRDSGFVCV